MIATVAYVILRVMAVWIVVGFLFGIVLGRMLHDAGGEDE